MTLTTSRRATNGTNGCVGPISVYFSGATTDDAGELDTWLLPDSKVRILTASSIEYIFSEIDPMGDCMVDGEPFHLHTGTRYYGMRPGNLHDRSVKGRIIDVRTPKGQIAARGVAFKQGFGTRVTNTELQLSAANDKGEYMMTNCFTTAPVEHLWRDGQQIF